MGDGRMQGVPQRSVIAGGLSEQHAALERSHEYVREVVEIGIAP